MPFDFSAPSFSLGLDFDFDEDKEVAPDPNLDNSTNVKDEDEKDDFEEIRSRPSLKRLRRGTSPSPPPLPPPPPEVASNLDQDDDIESFSSQEDVLPSSLHFNVCSSSKVPLHSHGILCSQSTGKSKVKTLPICSVSTSGNSMASSSKDLFPTLTISPLRKLNLLESYPSFSLGYSDEGKGNKKPPLSNTVDNDAELPQNHLVLKRLKRGAPQPTPSFLPKYGNVDAEIENISSQEFENDHHQENSTSLQNKQSSSTLKTSIISQVPNKSIPSSFEASTSKNSFKKSIISPVRRINLIDSDSDLDDPSSSKIISDGKKKKSVQFQTDTFWKEFSPKEKNITNISTPALDAFCDEYFKSSKCNTPSIRSSKVIDPEDSIDDFETIFEPKSGNGKFDHNWTFPNSKPPAYQYFFHEDARVRNLVEERLPHFVPNGVKNPRESQHNYGEDDINYMGQFGNGTGQTQGNKNKKNGSSSNTKVVKQRRPGNTSKSKEFTDNTGEWVNPRNTASVPKDAGKRRVSAVGSQCGGWFTGQDGRKVYVSKTGQELTGQFAYRQYRRESGIASKKGKKKVTTKKSKKG